MRRVLIVVDDYTSAEAAARHVLSGAALGPVEEAVLLHAHAPVRSYAARFFAPQALRALRAADGRRLLGDAQALLEGAGVRTSFHSEPGDIAPTVAAVARERAADAIVMGSEPAGAFRRLMFRLLVWQVVRQADVPVHIVGASEAGRAPERARPRLRPAYPH